MVFYNPSADFYIPDGVSEDEALRRITHLGIGAHQDDLEFMAFHGILTCHSNEDKWFGGVTCTDGGSYCSIKDISYEDKKRLRRREQRIAAMIGHYGVMIQLDYPSAEAKSTHSTALVSDIEKILLKTQPNTVYTHNLADKHDTHVAVAVAVIKALRVLPVEKRPSQVFGCEMWRGLDWLNDEQKIGLDVSGHDHLAKSLSGIFDSQISGGKRYDKATLGRRQANATFFKPTEPDQADQLCFAMDLTPLVKNEKLDLVEYTCKFIEIFHADVEHRLSRFTERT